MKYRAPEASYASDDDDSEDDAHVIVATTNNAARWLDDGLDDEDSERNASYTVAGDRTLPFSSTASDTDAANTNVSTLLPSLRNLSMIYPPSPK